MNATYYVTALMCLSHVLLSMAEPGGELSFSIKQSGGTVFQVQEMNLTGGMPRVILENTCQFGGIDAPPWLGDPAVVCDYGSGVCCSGIRLFGNYGMTGVVIDCNSVTNPRDPGYSFNGEMLAFVARDAGPSGADILHLITPGGMNHTTIHQSGSNTDIRRPRFTPDGNYLMFQSVSTTTSQGDITMISVTGGPTWKVSNLPEDGQHPAVSPDGRLRACVGEVGGTMTLFIAGTDGSASWQVNLGGEYALYPAFSPDSRYIAVISDNGINIIELVTNTVIRHLPVDYDIPYGLCWHSGALPADGAITKMKINDKGLMIKTVGVVPMSGPTYGAIQIDSLLFPLDSAAAWQDKKGKKFMYNDKILKRKATAVVKNEKGGVSAKKLSLVNGVDYHTGTNVTVMINMGGITLVRTIPLDEKGKYKRPK